MKVLLCPQCKKPPLFHYGCKNCGSDEINSKKFLHHFACAHVGDVEDFKKEDITCPKCLTDGLVVNRDLEFLTGPFSCNKCGWTDTNREIVGFCSDCDLKFPIRFCEELEDAE